jgi:hypothetical protein
VRRRKEQVKVHRSHADKRELASDSSLTTSESSSIVKCVLTTTIRFLLVSHELSTNTNPLIVLRRSNKLRQLHNTQLTSYSPITSLTPLRFCQPSRQRPGADSTYKRLSPWTTIINTHDALPHYHNSSHLNSAFCTYTLILRPCRMRLRPNRTQQQHLRQRLRNFILHKHLLQLLDPRLSRCLRLQLVRWLRVHVSRVSFIVLR